MSEDTQKEIPKEIQKTITITGGHVVLKDFISRKTAKTYSQILMAKVSTKQLKSKKGNEEDLIAKADAEDGVKAEEESGMDISLNALTDAQESLVLNLIESIMIDGEAVVVSQGFLDNLRNKDYEAISSVCSEMMLAETNAKKK